MHIYLILWLALQLFEQLISSQSHDRNGRVKTLATLKVHVTQAVAIANTISSVETPQGRRARCGEVQTVLQSASAPTKREGAVRWAARNSILTSTDGGSACDASWNSRCSAGGKHSGHMQSRICFLASSAARCTPAGLHLPGRQTE